MNNILFILSRYPGYGGIEMVTNYVSRYLSSSGHKVYIYSSYSEDDGSLLGLKSEDVVFIEGDTDSKIIESQVLEIIRSCSIDTIIFQDSYAFDCGVLQRIKNKANVRIVVAEHNTPDCFLRAFVNANIEKINVKYFISRTVLYPYFYLKVLLITIFRHRKLYKISDDYVLLSKNFIPIIKKYLFFLDDSKLTTINNPITIDSPASFIEKKDKLCVFSGRLVSQKGCDKLLKIWSLVENRHDDWRLVIVGDGPERKKLEDLSVRLKLKNVDFVGFRLDVSEYYKRASILCMTSLYEGWLLSITESMAYSCAPVIFNSYAAASEIITNDKTGFLINPFKIDEYVDVLNKLFEDSDLLYSIRKGAYIESHKFSIDSIGKAWDKLIKKLNENC